MEKLQETVDFVAKGRRRTGPPGCLGDVHNIESELVQRNREIAQVRDQLGQREVETTRWKSRHGDLVGKLTDLEAERSKLRVHVRELCDRLEASLEQQRALHARVEVAEAELLKQEAEVKAQLEAERTFAAKHAADLEGQLAKERSARLAAEAKLEALCVQQRTKLQQQHLQQQQQQQHRQQRSPPSRSKQRRASLPELRLEFKSTVPEHNKHQEQGVEADEREMTTSEAVGQTRPLPAAACWLTLAASDPSLLGLLENAVEASDAVRAGDGHEAVVNVGSAGGIGERAQTVGMAAMGQRSNGSPQAMTAATAAAAAAASLPATPAAVSQIVVGQQGCDATAVAGAAPKPLEEAELRVQLRLLQMEVETLQRLQSEMLAMAAEDTLAYRSQGLEVATGALAREALMAAQLEETRRARSVELRALIMRMSKHDGSTANVGKSLRARSSVVPRPLVHGCATGGA